MAPQRGVCALMCGELATTTVCGHRLCPSCVARLRAIAADAGVVIDEGLLGGALRRLSRRQLNRAEKELEANIERREIAAARRTA